MSFTWVRRCTVVAFVAALFAPSGVLAGPICAGDCDGDNAVSVAELVQAVDILLEVSPVNACSAADGDDDGAVTIDEVVRALGNSVSGCPSP